MKHSNTVTTLFNLQNSCTYNQHWHWPKGQTVFLWLPAPKDSTRVEESSSEGSGDGSDLSSSSDKRLGAARSTFSYHHPSAQVTQCWSCMRPHLWPRSSLTLTQRLSVPHTAPLKHIHPGASYQSFSFSEDNALKYFIKLLSWWKGPQRGALIFEGNKWLIMLPKIRWVHMSTQQHAIHFRPLQLTSAGMGGGWGIADIDKDH